MLCYEELKLPDKLIALASEWMHVIEGDDELSKRLLSVYLDICRYKDASELLDRLNGRKDIELGAARVYIAAMEGDWERMLACSLELFQYIAPGKEPSLEGIIGMPEELNRKNELKAAVYMRQSIAIFAAKSHF